MRRRFSLRVRMPLLLLLLAFSAGCAMFKGGAKVKYPNSVTSEMRSEYALAENEFKAQRYAQAETGFQNFIQRHPYNELTDSSQFRIGQIQMLRKDYDGATATFDRLVGKTPTPTSPRALGSRRASASFAWATTNAAWGTSTRPIPRP